VKETARVDRLLILAAGVPALCLFAPLFVPLGTGQVFTGNDLSAFHLPMRFLYSSALESGHSILWTSHLFNGFYMHAEGQIGALHPLHLLLYTLLPLVVAFNIEFIASYVAAFSGLWLFLRRAGLGGASSLVGATAYAFSGFMLLHYIHMNGVAIAAHIPWLLLALDAWIGGSAKERRVAFAAISLLAGSQVLLGYPQYVWMSALTCGIYGIVRARQLSAWRRVLPAAVAAAMGLVVGGAQLLPTLDLLAESARATVDREFVLTFSLHPLNILQLLSPYVFAQRAYWEPGEAFVHEFGVYNGAFCTAAAVYVLSRWRQLAFRHLAVFGLALCIVGIVLSLGRHGFVYEQLASIPFLGTFRAPARHLLLVHAGLSLLAAIAFDDLVRTSTERAWQPAAPAWTAATIAASAAATACAWLFPHVFASGSAPIAKAWTIGGAALLGTAALLVHHAARGRRIPLLVLPAFLAADLGIWGYSYVWEAGPRTVESTAAQIPVPQIHAGSTIHLNTADTRRNLVVLRGLKLFVPYVGLPPSRILPAEDDDALRVGGVSWIRDGGRWRQVRGPMPRARLLFETRASTDPAGDLEKIDVSRTALVAPGTPSPGVDGDGMAGVLLDAPGRLEIGIRTSTPALLVTTEAYHAGWTANAEGREAATTRVYGDYLGVVVEPGEYRLALRFSPQSARWGLWLSLGGLAATFGIAGVWAIPRWREGRARRRVSD
jgi:hypothetical protein